MLKKLGFLTAISSALMLSTNVPIQDLIPVVTQDTANAVYDEQEVVIEKKSLSNPPITNIGLDNTKNLAETEVLNTKINYSSSAKSAIMLDAKTGRVLYEKNANQQLPMASTTKIVTAITVIDNCENLDEVVKIDSKAVGVEGTSIYLRTGEQLTVRELLYGLMLRSGNDAATALALHTGGTLENFCKMMDEKAKECGAENSSFKNPHGLDAKGHYTTAKDLALITSYALSNKDFAKIVSTKSITIGEGESKRLLLNKNKLLSKLDGCIGVKTGFTDDAGRCLVSACERDNLKLVSVVFNCGPMFEESQELLELGFENFSMCEILPPYQSMDNVPVENGVKEYVGTYSQKGLSLPLSKQEESNINIVIDLKPMVTAPVEKDQEIGKVEVYAGKHLIFSEKIYTMEAVDSKLIKDKVKDILDNWNA
ncbi:MAG: D-alanyl-D-alanine carboxypeptidase [Clostridia bacterium]|nr:D-alanyl-D-alanine carboxypeptidase [Clostridia bacterium]